MIKVAQNPKSPLNHSKPLHLIRNISCVNTQHHILFLLDEKQLVQVNTAHALQTYNSIKDRLPRVIISCFQRAHQTNMKARAEARPEVPWPQPLAVMQFAYIFSQLKSWSRTDRCRLVCVCRYRTPTFTQGLEYLYDFKLYSRAGIHKRGCPFSHYLSYNNSLIIYYLTGA